MNVKKNIIPGIYTQKKIFCRSIINIFIYCLIILIFNCSDRTIRVDFQGAEKCSQNKFVSEYNHPSHEKIIEIFENPNLNGISKKSIEISIAYNFYEDLIQFKSLENKKFTTDIEKISYLLLKDKIIQHIHYAQLDINSMESELRCYMDRFSEIINELKDRESDYVRKYSFYAILTGGIGTFFDGGTADVTSYNRIVIVTSGVLITYFSYLASDPMVEVKFTPKSTILKDLYNNPDTSKSFSKPIWFLLTKNYAEPETGSTERVKLVDKWFENGYLGRDEKSKERLIELYFKKQNYSSNIKEMENRKEMISETLVVLGLFQQLILKFHYEITQIEGKIGKNNFQ